MSVLRFRTFKFSFFTLSAVFLLSSQLVMAQTIVTPATTPTEPNLVEPAAPKIMTPNEEAPISLFPADDDDELFQSDDETSAKKTIVEDTGHPEGSIIEESLAVIDPATTGLLGDSSGGLGFDMWAGSDRRAMKDAFKNVPSRINSQTLQDLARRLLLTSANTPALPEGHETDIVTDGVDVLRLRVDQLMSLGHVDAARQLIMASGFEEKHLQLFVETLVEISLLERDYNQTCVLVQSQTDKWDQAFWQKHLIFCQLLAKDVDAASFSTTMLQDIGEEDDLFYALVDLMVSGASESVTPLPVEDSPTALHLALYQVVGVALPDTLLSAATNPALLKAIVDNPKTDIEVRLNAAEQANQLGLISGDTLAALYAAQPLSQEALQTPISTAEEDYSAINRALLYQVAVNDPVPETRAIIVAKAFELSKKADHYQMTLSAFSPILARMPISADLWDFSGEAARALYALGRPKPAQAWISHLSDQALRDPEAETELLRLWALSRVASTDVRFAIEEEAGRTAWTAYVEASVDESEVEYLRRLNMTYGLLEALDRPAVSVAAWEEMATREGNMIMLTPNPAHVRLMQNAAAGGKRGETIGWALRLLSEVSMTQVAPSVIAETIRALRGVGLVNEAQKLALETAMANGL